MIKILPDSDVVISAIIYKNKKKLKELSKSRDKDAAKLFEVFDKDEIVRTLTVFGESNQRLVKMIQKVMEDKGLNDVEEGNMIDSLKTDSSTKLRLLLI